MIDAAALEDAKRRYDFLAAVPGLALHARTNGGEYHGPCPRAGCGGADRFVVWPRHPGGVPLAWCRQCHDSPMNGLDFLMWRDGCDFLTACRGLGVTEAPAPARPRAVAFYDYQAESGALLYQVVRREPKSFLCRRPRVPTPRNDVDTDWDYRMTDVPRVLYHLPALGAAPPEAVVWLVEGEKDADTLTAAGLLATTAPHGAKSWRPTYAEALRDRYVVIVPDADADGAAWARDVVASVAPVARRLKTVLLPPGAKDVSDFLAGGGTLEDLQALARAADSAPPEPAAPPPRFQVLGDAESDAIPPLRWLVDGYLLAGAINVWHGEGGSGKSLLALDLALTLATGAESWQGVPCAPGPVVYLAAEGPEEISARKRAWKAAFGQPTIPAFYLVPDRVPFLDSTAIPALLGCLPADLAPSLIVVDTLARTMGADGNENETQDMNAFVAACDTLRLATGAAVLVIHHDNKAGQIRGSVSLFNAARAVVKIDGDDGTLTALGTKHNNSGEPAPLRLAFRPAGESVVLGPAAPGDGAHGPLPNTQRQVLDLLCSPSFGGTATSAEIARRAEYSERSVHRALDALIKRGYVSTPSPPRTPGRRFTATPAGYAAIGAKPAEIGGSLAGLLHGALTGTDSPDPAPVGTDGQECPPLPTPPLTGTDSPATPAQARTDRTDKALTLVAVSDCQTPPPPYRGGGVSLTVGANPADPLAPTWAPPPDTAPPRPAHLGYCGHGTLAVAWDAGPPARWRCRSCWELHRE